MVKRSFIKSLAAALGSEYRIVTIDFDDAIYRRFGNGFDVEVCGCSKEEYIGSASIYLWFNKGRGSEPIPVKKVCGVDRTAGAIREAVEGLYDYSRHLIAQGYDDSDKIAELAAGNA